MVNKCRENFCFFILMLKLPKCPWVLAAQGIFDSSTLYVTFPVGQFQILIPSPKHSLFVVEAYKYLPERAPSRMCIWEPYVYFQFFFFRMIHLHIKGGVSYESLSLCWWRGRGSPNKHHKWTVISLVSLPKKKPKTSTGLKKNKNK
jgi:hypothetical protein